jgi:predicted secreted protein
MAVLALTDAVITIAGVAVQTKSNSVTLNYEIDSIEVTSFDGSGARKFAGGLQNTSCEVTLMQNFASAQVEATIYPLVGTITNVILKPKVGTISASLPQYTLTGAYLAAHTPIAGGVGELSTTTLSFTGGVLTKIVTPPT